MMNDILIHTESYAELGNGEKVSVNPHMERIEDNIYCISASSVKNVRKIVICFEIPNVEKYPHLMIHDFFASGFKKNEGINKSVFFLSAFNDDGVGITVMNKLPSKFRSNMSVENKDGKMLLSLETVIPFSFEGESESESFIIAAGMEYTKALLFNTKNRKASEAEENPIGWGSWDYYFTSVDEEAVRENTDFIANDEILSKKVKYIEIDDGWQQREGDWKEGCRFKNGLEKTTEYIRGKGYVPGIWTAPTRLHYLSGTVMRRNDFLVRNSLGDPQMDEEFYILDPTHPDGEKFIREIYTYLSEKGFGFYKIDFISNMLFAESFYDKNAGPYDALRKLLGIIRECVGDGHIMGCSLPYGYAGEYVNSRRTGLDIHNTWKHIKKCSEIYFPQFASHKTVYQNDLDYLIVRGNETSTEEDTNVINPARGKYLSEPTEDFRWRDGEDFTYDEAKFWCAIILMSGSSIFLSDRLSLLNEKGLDLVRKTVENADFISAVPDCNKGEFPNIWRKENFICILNYTEETKTYHLTASGKYEDIFSGEQFTSEGEKLTITLKKHDCLVLKKG